MGTILRLHLQQVLVIEPGLALSHLVERVTNEHGAQRTLTRAVRPHDGMRLAIADYQVDAL